MIAAISIMRPKPGLATGQFRRHWLHPHGTMTAELPCLRRYVQSHCITHPASNAPARALAIAGFPSLWFDSIADRQVAYTSPRIAECNVDSEQFVGAVCRLVTEPAAPATAPLPVGPGQAKAILLGIGAPDPAWPADLERQVQSLHGVAGLITHRLIEQAAAPNSRIPELKVAVAGVAEIVLDSDRAFVMASAALSAWRDTTAVFAVEDVVFR